MGPKRINEDKERLVEYLDSLPRDEATRHICLLAMGAVSAIRKDYALWSVIERMIFNATILLLCKDKIANDDLTEMINYGIQIEDLRQFTVDPRPFANITQDVETRAMELLARNAADK